MFLLQQSTHRMLIRHHPQVGHLYVPSLHARLPNELGGYQVVTNSSGFRSDFDFTAARKGVPRILMFGDSYTAGDNCSNPDRFSDQLARLLNVEVYNYGVSGTGTDQHLLIFREFAKEIEADLIVICVQIDSMRRIQLSHRESIDRVSRRKVLIPKPYFQLENGRLVLHSVPVPKERPEVGSLNPETSDGTTKLSGIRESLLQWYRESPELERARRWIRKDLGRVKSEMFRLSGAQPYPDFKSQDSPGWLLMKAILQEFVRDVAPRPVLIVPIPTWEFYLHGLEPIYQPFFQTLENQAEGIHVLDVSTPLIQLPWDTRQELSFKVGGHFTTFGHEKVARMMGEKIQQSRLLPDCSTVPLSANNGSGKPAARPRYVLGLSCMYHNSAASLIKDGRILAAAEEERFTRIKNDRRFPYQAVNYCLEEGGINPGDLSAVVYYDNTSMTFERLMHSQLAAGEKGEDNWTRYMPSWLRYKLHLPQLIREYLKYDGLVLQEIHHRSHAASAFYPSPFESAAILTVDGVGEWATASIGVGRGNNVELMQEMRFPHSLGLLYSAITQFTGFKVNSGEYKMMGLAPYGKPIYVQQILDHLVDLKEDGSVELNLEHFGFLHQRSMIDERIGELFGGPARTPESRITRREMDLAASIQSITEEAILRMGRHAHKLTGEARLCLAGGVALNCVANGRLLREGPFQDIWIQPAAGDSGCALGAALDVYHTYFGQERVLGHRPEQGASCWGPSFSDDEIGSFLDTFGYPYRKVTAEERASFVAQCLIDGRIVGNFSGRLEYGPRALGSRSILADARNPEMQAELNLRIKYRESFRPFAPSVLAERVQDYFELDRESPYMLIVAPVQAARRKPVEQMEGEDMLPVVRQLRSDLPAITHVDYSARIQTVVREDNPVYYDLIHKFEELTGCGVIVNTSFNVRGEPIVCTPFDAYRCFMRTEMNVLALGNYILIKEEQPTWPEGKGEGLESEDVTQAEVSKEADSLIRDLQRIYENEFLPLSKELQAKSAVLVDPAFRRVPSTWTQYTQPAAAKDVFKIPVELDSPDPVPDKFADAMLEYWQPGPATSALRPVLTKLIALGLRYPPAGALEEDIPESIYVMF